MSLLYDALYFISSLLYDAEIISYEIDPLIKLSRNYDFIDFQRTDKKIKWGLHKDVVYIDSIDSNLFDESVTPPIAMYVGIVKPILKSSSFDLSMGR